MSHLLNLNRELQDIIIAEITESERPLISLKNVSLTCQAMHYIIAPLLFRRVVIDYCKLTDISQLSFLSSNERVRGYVQEVDIPIAVGEVPEEWVAALMKLLPQLQNLRRISVSGDVDFLVASNWPFECEGDDDKIGIRTIRASLFNLIKSLNKEIEISVNRYVFTIDHSGFDLSLFGPSLSSLRLQIIHCVNFDFCGPTGPIPDISERPPKMESSPSMGVGHMLRSCQNLSRLCLMLPLIGTFEQKCVAHHALEEIVLSQTFLKELAIYGDFFLTDTAWSHWQLIPWRQMESLSLGPQFLIEEFAVRLMNQPFPSLRTLNLFADRGYYERPPRTASSSLLQLLCRLNLTRLHFIGQSPELLFSYLAYDDKKASSLERLLFHQAGDDARLSISHLETLTICPRLSWLGLDIERQDLPYRLNKDRKVQYVEAFAALKALSHLHIFVPVGEEQTCMSTIKEVEAVTIFRNIQSRKQGCQLQSMIIYADDFAQKGLCGVWSWGADRVIVDCRRPTEHLVLSRRLEIWDLNNVVKLEDCFTRNRHWAVLESGASEDLLWSPENMW